MWLSIFFAVMTVGIRMYGSEFFVVTFFILFKKGAARDC